MIDLRGQILNLRRDYYPHNLCRDDVPMAYRMGYRDARHDAAALAASHDAELAELRKDAERYRKLRAMVRGERHLGTGHNQGFAFPSRYELQPLADIMRGSVAQHLDATIDLLPAVG